MQAARFYWEKDKIVWEGESHREEAHRSADPLRLSGSSTEKSQKQPAHQEQDVLQDGVRQMWTVSGLKISHLSHIRSRHANSCAISSCCGKCVAFLQEVKVSALQLFSIFVGDQIINLKLKV